jgi:hypothetical protein
MTMDLSSRARASLSSRFLIPNVIVWISSFIVMGIMCYWFSSQHQQPDFNVYILVIVRLSLSVAINRQYR